MEDYKEFVESVLVTWAVWAAKMEDLGFGWSRRVAWMNLTPNKDYRERGLLLATDEEALKIESVINALPEQERTAIIVHWLKTGSIKQRLKRYRMSNKTLYNRLNSAYKLIYKALREGCG